MEEEKVEQNAKPKRKPRKTKELQYKEEDLPNIYYFPKATEVEGFQGKNITKVFAAGQYSYILETMPEGSN